MNLLMKFNLILVVLFGTGGLILSQAIHRFLIENAQREVRNDAQLMRASAESVREYTAADIGPLLEKNPEHKTKFLAETVPAFGAMSTFNKLRQNYPDYTYREATLNPTNPEHRATDWEADIIRYLRDNPNQKEVNGERTTPMGLTMYLATPIVAGAPCQECHSTPAAAPAAMTATYGSNNGFGWKQGSVVGAQIVSVPMSVPLQKAGEAFRLLVLFLIATLVVATAVLDAAAYFVVIRPLRRVAESADRVSKGEADVAALPVKGNDEIAAVTAAFNRMQMSMAKALKMLG